MVLFDLKENDGSLAIYPTMMTDLGEYECVIQNRAGEKQSAKAYLNVQCQLKPHLLNKFKK